MPKLLNDCRMPSTEPRILTRMFAGTLRVCDDLVDLVGKAAEVLARWRDIDVDDAAELVVVDFGGRVDHLYMLETASEVGRVCVVLAAAMEFA